MDKFELVDTSSASTIGRKWLRVEKRSFERLAANGRFVERLYDLEMTYAALVEAFVTIEKVKTTKSLERMYYPGAFFHSEVAERYQHRQLTRNFSSAVIGLLSIGRLYVDQVDSFLKEYSQKKFAKKIKTELTGYKPITNAKKNARKTKPIVFENCFFHELRNAMQHSTQGMVGYGSSVPYSSQRSESDWLDELPDSFWQTYPQLNLNKIKSISSSAKKKFELIQKTFPDKWTTFTGFGEGAGDLGELLPKYLENLSKTHTKIRKKVSWRKKKAEKVFESARGTYLKLNLNGNEKSIFLFRNRDESDFCLDVSTSALGNISELEHEFAGSEQIRDRILLGDQSPSARAIHSPSPAIV
jgi:hypothetical protein